MKNLGITFMLVGILQACGTPFDIEANCNNGFYTSTEGEIMQWNDGAQIDFEAHSSVPNIYLDALEAAGSRYNEVFKKTRLNLVSGLDTPAFKGNVNSVAGDNVNAIYWVENKDWPWAKSDPDAVAMTVVNFSPEGIVEADIFYKASLFREPSAEVAQEDRHMEMPDLSITSALTRFVSSARLTRMDAAYNISSSNNNYTEHRVYMVGIHEFGHAIGRCHSKNPESIMYTSVGSGTPEERAQPFSELDFDIFDKAYSLF